MISRQELLDAIKWKSVEENYKQLDKFIDISPGDYIFDCGACHGEISFYLLTRTGENGKVYSIEAESDNYNILCKSIDLLNIGKHVIPIHLAVSNKKSVIKLYKSNHKTRHSIFQNLMEDRTYYELTKSDTLDSIQRRYNIPKIDYIYMNIEGAEYLALEGMKNILEKYKPSLCIDDHKNDIFKFDIPTLLKSYGYEVRIVIDNPKDRVIIGDYKK